MATTSIDPAAVAAAAARIAAAADLLDSAAAAEPRFTGHTAGRAHAADGHHLRLALDRLRAGLGGWALAAEELAAALHTGAQRYRAAEEHAATTLR